MDQTMPAESQVQNETEPIEAPAESHSGAGSNEYERTPVPRSALLYFKSFVGMYAGEHCAGTELMIGPLFVAAGVSAFDVVVGLIVGNALAVLSWIFLTAPIATRARLTLYNQLEKICGRRLVVLYNLVNGVMFCCLAGAMVTVSATALTVWFDLPTPALNDLYPNSVAWVLAVFLVGVLFTVVAAVGYNLVARIGNIAAPWMVLVFVSFGLIALRDFMVASDTVIRGPADLWHLATTEIWRGGEPLPGRVKFGFFHVMFFAWFCNMAMHIGMSDLSIFRYARKSWYAVASAAGMYTGHFLAWLAASMLFALQLRSAGLVNAEAIRAAAAANTLPAPLPGPLAHGACGLAGLICVIVAGWTTANPTIYRAGLAFQAIAPRSNRFVVTLVTGMIAAVAATFPALAMKLLEFVALYGMLLMPMGAVVFVDFWLMKRLGLSNNYAEQTGRVFNLAAFLTWFITLGLCVLLVYQANVQIYFVSLPGWFMAVVLYILLSKLLQRPGPIPRPATSIGGAA